MQHQILRASFDWSTALTIMDLAKLVFNSVAPSERHIYAHTLEVLGHVLATFKLAAAT